LLLFTILIICAAGFSGCAGTTRTLTEKQVLAFSTAKTVDLYYPVDSVNEKERQRIKTLITESGREIVSEHKQDRYENTSSKELMLNNMKRQVDKKEQEKAIRQGKKYVPEDKRGDMCIFFFSSLIRDLTHIETVDAFHKQIVVCGKEYEGGIIISAPGIEPYVSSGKYGISRCPGTQPQLGLSLFDRLQNILLTDIVPFPSYADISRQWPAPNQGQCRVVVFYPKIRTAPAKDRTPDQEQPRYRLSDEFEFSNAWKVRIPDGSFVFMDITDGRHTMKYGGSALDVHGEAGKTVYIRLAEGAMAVTEEYALKVLPSFHHGFKNALPLDKQGK